MIEKPTTEIVVIKAWKVYSRCPNGCERKNLDLIKEYKNFVTECQVCSRTYTVELEEDAE